MRSSGLTAFTALAVLTILVGTAHAASSAPDTVFYALDHESTFEYGCFGPCACPVLVRNPVLGSFKLTKLAPDPLFDHYSIDDVKWTVAGEPSIALTGSGTYRRGGEVAIQEQLTLDLSINGGAPRHFDSGLVTPQAQFPEFRIRVSLHPQACFDTEMVVVAKPLGSAWVGGAGSTFLAAAPNPFRSSTWIGFTLPQAGPVDLVVFDVQGREQVVLARGEAMTAGAHGRTWNGCDPSGRALPPGVYLVRLRTPDGSEVRSLIKLD